MATLKEVLKDSVYIRSIDDTYVDEDLEVDPEVLEDENITCPEGLEYAIQYCMTGDWDDRVFFDPREEVIIATSGRFMAKDLKGIYRFLDIGYFTPLDPSEIA